MTYILPVELLIVQPAETSEIEKQETQNQRTNNHKWLYFVIGVIILLIVFVSIYWVPQYQAGLYKAQVRSVGELTKAERIQLEKDAVDYANKARTTLAQAIGGFLLLGSIGVALWNAMIAQTTARAALQNAQAAQTNAETAQKNYLLAEATAKKNLVLRQLLNLGLLIPHQVQSQLVNAAPTLIFGFDGALDYLESSKITERFSKAIELLGNKESLDVRIGAIYALERIARDSQPDHWTVMEVLTAFIREHAKEPIAQIFENEYEIVDFSKNTATTSAGTATDIQAALTVIGRRKWRESETEHQKLDLQKAYLPKAYLCEAHLEGALFYDAHLKMANLFGVHLEKADLRGAHLEGALLCYAHLEEANLRCAHLEGANLFLTHLNNTKLKSASGLIWEKLSQANMDGSPWELPPTLLTKWNEEKKRRDEEEANNRPNESE